VDGGGRRRGLTWLAAGAAAVAAAVALGLPPIAQDPGYHAFADRRALLGVPNVANVVSNLPFLVVGALGLAAVRRGAVVVREPWERRAWGLVFGGAAATGLGSAWYHWAPANATLVWDRLPITLVLMALFALVIGERLDPRAGRRLLPWLLAAGAASVVWWHASEAAGRGDLRFYGLVQFFPLVAIPALLAARPPAYTRGADLAVALGWYAGAKLFEHFDAAVWAAGGVTGGHALKHLASATALAWLLWMVRRRRALSAPVSPACASRGGAPPG
jgi:hypothetical protein